MFWFKRHPRFAVRLTAIYVAQHLGKLNSKNISESHIYEDEKIKVESHGTFEPSVYISIKMPDRHENVMHETAGFFEPIHDYEIYRYGRWVNYLYSLESKADEARWQKNMEEAAHKHHNFSDIDDSVIFGDEYAV